MEIFHDLKLMMSHFCFSLLSNLPHIWCVASTILLWHTIVIEEARGTHGQPKMGENWQNCVFDEKNGKKCQWLGEKSFEKPLIITSFGQMDSSNLHEMVGGGGGVGSPIGGMAKWGKMAKMAKMADSLKISKMEISSLQIFQLHLYLYLHQFLKTKWDSETTWRMLAEGGSPILGHFCG